METEAKTEVVAAPEVKTETVTLTSEQVNTMIEAALQQRLNPLYKDVKEISKKMQPAKTSPVEEENRTLHSRLAAIETEREAERSENKRLKIDGSLERELLAKGVPADSVDIAKAYILQSHGSKFVVDGNGRVSHQSDEYTDAVPVGSLIDGLLKTPGLGRLLPPVNVLASRGQKGQSNESSGPKKLADLSDQDLKQFKTAADMARYFSQNG